MRQRDNALLLSSHPLHHRLVKGTGEIIEEIVSKERQKQINKVGWKCL